MKQRSFCFLCKVKILMLHQHFKTPRSGGAIRSYYLAKSLVDKGHRVVVITSHNDKAKIFLEDGIEVHYLPITYDNRFTFYTRVWSFVMFMMRASGRAWTFRDFDYCYAISVPLTIGLSARWIKLVYGIPYLFEVGDLWPEAPIQMGFVTNQRLQKILFSLELMIYKSAESIVALSPAIQESVQAKIPAKEVHLIPNMADCEFYKPAKKSAKLEEKFGVSGRFVVSYVGALGIANGLEYMLACAEAMRAVNDSVHFIICGEGAKREFIERKIQEPGLPNVSLLDFRDREGVLEIMEVTDAVFISYKPVPILETGSPNKYFDGLAAGKLIIVNFSGWIRHEIEQEGCGFYTDPTAPWKFPEQLSPFLVNPEQLIRAQSDARKLAERKYSRIVLSQRFADLFKPRE